ncbi:SCA7, zinc-binding domain-containing protein [Pseudomassariella vexata]|uniref:SCA7, zinc-binding domain-domain-containing protein n=1 Tax=Pseudomassariella vexata TaxID=1141098 RepID=A0A1Y2DU39_9PEZI|nr:SCA7, zinc-binding domain-containing protein [Pseudomassariella vexata]ORY62155.1 SCA7, zinc-binding domain-domain-containing protein [Pseudomassariella vexata]
MYTHQQGSIFNPVMPNEITPAVYIGRQCGVPNGSDDRPCTCALTCRAHSMGAKRTVPGRLLLFDMWLSGYRRQMGERREERERQQGQEGVQAEEPEEQQQEQKLECPAGHWSMGFAGGLRDQVLWGLDGCFE